MARIARKSDGRRIFPAEFKREHIGRVLRGELTLAELSRKLGIARSLLQRWKRLTPLEPAPGDPSRRHRGPVGGPRDARYIRELQLLIGKQAVELELLRGELDALRKGRRAQGAAGR
jgi:transposase-like protein